MLDRATFTREFTLLLERFGRDPHPLLIARYFDYLDARLTTAEFQAAAKKLFEEARYWPAPIDFLHAAKGDPQQLARQEWDQLIDEARHGRLAELSDRGQAALRAVGGWRTIAYANETALPSLRRAFLDSHAPPAPQQLTLESPT